MKSMEELVDFYFRPNRLPHLWCPGCGNGVILGALLKAIDAENLAKDDVAIISGIGCSSRASGYVDFNTANTLHGRALPISTGLKMARPELNVITLSGEDEGYLGLVTTRMYERVIELTRLDFRDVPLMLYGPFEAPIYRVQNTCRMRLVLKCRLTKRTRAFLAELMTEFGKAGPSRFTGGMVQTRSARRVTVSVDLNPSTV